MPTVVSCWGLSSGRQYQAHPNCSSSLLPSLTNPTAILLDGLGIHSSWTHCPSFGWDGVNSPFSEQVCGVSLLHVLKYCVVLRATRNYKAQPKYIPLTSFQATLGGFEITVLLVPP